ncbi:hypothetical protein GUJ93_ZPchr0001g31385 [Zizania palustris]|uniref:Uncharacterized protein n=1 Tax=Zizania palustris TaxID=103762 RepID=A0A8J5RVU9_ZIZPA|nr:hypothetical protein GUJ93_ZPchr0001g31385 [Zizania palustris]
MANVNPIARDVFGNRHHLLRDFDEVEIFLNAVRAELDDNDARLAVVEALLVEARCLAGQLCTMDIVPGPAELVEFTEDARLIEEDLRVLLENRRQLFRAIELLVVAHPIAAARRRARLVPRILLATAALALARAASVYGREAPGFMWIFLMVTILLMVFLRKMV